MLPSDLAVYYFEMTNKGSDVTEVVINENGTLGKWPKEFFEENLKDSFSLLEAANNSDSSNN
jgi:predicted ATPase